MKVKTFLSSIIILFFAITIVGCNSGSSTTSTNNIQSNNQIISTSNDGLIVTNPSSSDIKWGNDSLINIPIGSKGLKAIKVTNTTNQAFNKLTLETSSNKPSSITIDNDRTTCSMGLPLAANASCLYVFEYNPTGSYESGVFTATVSAEQSDTISHAVIEINYSTRVNVNAGTLAVNVDAAALNCTTTSCNGTLYVVNSKGDKVSTIVTITGSNGTVFGAGLVNLDPSDSYTIKASPINGSIPVYSPNQTIRLVADQTTTVTVTYPKAPNVSGKAIITLPKVVPEYTGTLKVQILNTKNGNQVIDSSDLKQGETSVVDLPISDDSHSYVVKLDNGIADPVNGLFYDQQSVTPLEITAAAITNLSIPLEKSTSLSNIELNITGLQYENKTSSIMDTANVTFNDVTNHYKYINQYNQSTGLKTYKIKNGLDFTIQTQANGTNNYKINPIINTFNVNGDKNLVANFQTGTNTLGRISLKLDIIEPNYTNSVPIQLINTKNNNQVVREFNLKQGDSTTLYDIPVSDETHAYIVKITQVIIDPTHTMFTFNIPRSITVTNEKNDTILINNGITQTANTISLTINGLKNDLADVTFSNSNTFYNNGYTYSYVFVDYKNQNNGTTTYYLPNATTIKTTVNNFSGYKINPILSTTQSSTSKYYASFEALNPGQLTLITRHAPPGGGSIISNIAFSSDNKYAYAVTYGGSGYNLGSLSYYTLGNNNDSFTLNGSDNTSNHLQTKLVATPDGNDFYIGNQDSSIGSPTEASDFSLYHFKPSGNGALYLAEKTKGAFGSMDMTPNGYYLYSSYAPDLAQTSSLDYYNIQRSGNLVYFGQNSRVYFATFTTTNTRMYSPGADWDNSSNNYIAKIDAASILQNGILSSGLVYSISLKNIIPNSVLPYGASPPSRLSALTASKDGTHLYAVTEFNIRTAQTICVDADICHTEYIDHVYSSYILVLDIDSYGNLSFSQLVDSGTAVRSLSISSNQKYLYAVLTDGSIKQYGIK